MLFRALISLGVVALLIPRATDFVPSSEMPGRAVDSKPVSAASGDFRDILFDRLAAVKADIEQAERRRGGDSR